jgi:hypothetical protein
MEPADLNRNSPDDAQLEAWLRANSTRPPLPDDGFSAGVLAALPLAPRTSAISSSRGWFCAVGALLGVTIAAISGRHGPSGAEQLAALGPQLESAIAPLADPATLLALVVTALSLVFVYRRELLGRLVR